MSISPTFYARLFCTKILCEAFFNLHFKFDLLLAKEFWRKCAHKMLVKLTTVEEFQIFRWISDYFPFIDKSCWTLRCGQKVRSAVDWKLLRFFREQNWWWKSKIRSQSYKNLISSFFRFSLLSLSFCRTWKNCLYIKMAKLNSEKTEKIFVLRRKKFGRIDSWTN